jgi:glycerol-3-phosphate acyltransferase PlsY
MMPLLLLAGAYLLGGVPFGYLLVRLKTGRDVRSMGSGNIGATNVLRTSGRALGILTLALDVAKGYVAVWTAGRFTGNDPLWMSGAAFAVVLGHAFPIYLKFRGGKAVASCVGAFLCLAPLAVAAVTVVFVVTVAWGRYISLGSIVGAGLLPVAVWMILHPPTPVVASAFLCGLFIIWRHKSNLARLRAGTENVFSWRSKKS